MALLDGTGGIAAVIPLVGPPGVSVRGEVGERGATGRDGAAGPPGRVGPPGAGTTRTAVAAGPIPARTNVVDVGDGRCAPADPSNANHAGKLLGFVAGFVAPEGTATIVAIGSIQNASGDFSGGDALFIDDGSTGGPIGGLTNRAPTSGWTQPLGSATTSSDIIYQPGPWGLLSDGTPLVLAAGGTAPQASDAAAAQAVAGQWLDPATAPKAAFTRADITGPALLSSRDRVTGRDIDLRDYAGLDLTNTNSMTSLINRAFADAIREQRELVIPRGVLAIDGPLVGYGGALRFRGHAPRISNFKPGNYPTFQGFGTGTWFHFAHTGRGITVDTAADGMPTADTGFVTGHRFSGFGTFRDQGDPTVSGWAPINADFDISVRNGEAIVDAYTLNTSRFLELYNAGKSQFSLRGQPLIEGIRALYNYDEITGHVVAFWPWWSFHRNVKRYTNLTRIALRTGRADGLMVHKLFDFQGFAAHQVENATPVMATDPVSGQQYVLFPGNTTFDSHIGLIYGDSTCYTLLVQPGCELARLSYGKVIAQTADAGGLETLDDGTTPDPVYVGRQVCPILCLSGFSDISIDNFRSDFAGSSHVNITGDHARVAIRDTLYGGWNRADVLAPGSTPATDFPAFSISTSAPNARIEIGTMRRLNGGSGMRRPMPVLGYGAYLSSQDARTTLVDTNAPDVGFVTTPHITLQGTQSVDTFGRLAPGRQFKVLAVNGYTLNHSDMLKLPGAANIVVRPGDTFEIISDASSNWRVTSYQRANVPVPA